MVRPQRSNQNVFNFIYAFNPSLIETSGAECPIELPFYTGDDANLCINCNKYFNWDKKICGACPTGTSFVNNQCVWFYSKYWVIYSYITLYLDNY